MASGPFRINRFRDFPLEMAALPSWGSASLYPGLSPGRDPLELGFLPPAPAFLPLTSLL